jgi:hypothetical protein
MLSRVADYSEGHLVDFMRKEKNVPESDVDEVFDLLRKPELSQYSSLRDSDEEFFKSPLSDKVHEIALSYFSKYFPLNEVDTLWDLVLLSAKKLNVPVYDTGGNVLWPQEISHEEIVKMKEGSKQTK